MTHAKCAAVCLLLIFVTPVYAATCGCAGVPLLGALSENVPDGGHWNVATRFETSDHSDLVAGSRDVADETGRDRQSQSMIIEASYGVNEHWAVSGLFSYIEHERKVGAGSQVTSRGLGDAVVMLRYSPMKIRVFSRNSLTFGLGARLPIGEDDGVNAAVTLAEDMQPSTGARGVILWANGAHALSQAANTLLFANWGMSLNDKNDRDYRFGDSVELTLGVSHQTQGRWAFSTQLGWRKADRDERVGTPTPNTGGQWLNWGAAAQYQLTERLAGGIGVTLPVRRDLNDALQFTTSWAYSFTLRYAL